MDDLSSLLQGLNASDVERALRLLQQRKSQITETKAKEPEASPAPPPDDAQCTAVKTVELHPETETEAASEEDAESAADLDEIPFAFGALGIATLSGSEERNTPTKAASRVSKRKLKASANETTKSTLNGTDSAAATAAPASAKATPVVPQGLASFGFFTTAPKLTAAARSSTKLFSPFVPDKRIVARGLDFWSKKSDPAANVGQACSDQDIEERPPLTFETWVDAKVVKGSTEVANYPSECPGKMKTSIPEPYTGFNREVVFTGFFAIGYDPCQARPPYFGTHNNLQGGNMNSRELTQLGRSPLGEQMPRLSVLDYEYDSGDDWDAVEGGEDIGASSASEAEGDEGDSLTSSDLDFVIGDDDGSDSECELQQKIMEAREQRLRRLRGKEKLISSYSGPFVGTLPQDHPLQRWDRLDRARSLPSSTLFDMMQRELSEMGAMTPSVHGDTGSAGGGPANAGLIEAALKNRREMNESELAAMHEMISMNTKLSAKMIIDAFRSQHMCAGVARAEIERSVKRFYERHHGCLQRRAEPWSASDERLFTKTPKLHSSRNGEERALAGASNSSPAKVQDRNESPASLSEKLVVATDAMNSNGHDKIAAPAVGVGQPQVESASAQPASSGEETKATENEGANDEVYSSQRARESFVGCKRSRNQLSGVYDAEVQPAPRERNADPSPSTELPIADPST